MKTCIACSMPLMKSEDFGAETKDGSACVHCVNGDGSIKSCDEIFKGGVEFFVASISNIDRGLAERLVRKNMHKLPYWQNHRSSCLEGEQASDAEFAMALSKL